MNFITSTVNQCQYEGGLKMWFILQRSLRAVNTILPSVLQRLDSRDIEALILILVQVLNLFIGPIFLSAK